MTDLTPDTTKKVERMTLDEFDRHLHTLEVDTKRSSESEYTDGVGAGIACALANFRHHRDALIAGIEAERIKELDLIIETMEECLQAQEEETSTQGILRCEIYSRDGESHWLCHVVDTKGTVIFRIPNGFGEDPTSEDGIQAMCEATATSLNLNAKFVGAEAPHE